DTCYLALHPARRRCSTAHLVCAVKLPFRPATCQALIVTCLLLWPPVHMGLSHTLGFSPWRFGGWGMYAAPNRTPQLAPVSVVLIADPSAFKHPAVMVPILAGTTTLTTLAARKQGLDLRMAASDAHARRVIFEPHESLESWKQIAKDLQLARHLG